MMNDVHMGQAIRAIMNEQGLDNVWLAKQLGLHYSTARRMLNNAYLKMEWVIAISKLLNVNLLKLYLQEDIKAKDNYEQLKLELNERFQERIKVLDAANATKAHALEDENKKLARELELTRLRVTHLEEMVEVLKSR